METAFWMSAFLRFPKRIVPSVSGLFFAWKFKRIFQTCPGELLRDLRKFSKCTWAPGENMSAGVDGCLVHK